MFNLWFGVFFIITNFVLVLAMYKLFGRIGIFLWIAIATVLCNIQVLKVIDLVTIPWYGVWSAQLGNTLYGSIFLATDILTEKYGVKEAKKSVWLGFAASIITLITMQLALMFIPGVDDQFQQPLMDIFSFFPRIIAGSLIAYLTSQFLDIHLFSRIRAKYPNLLWLRNNAATMMSQFIDTLIFTSIAFIGVYSFDLFVEIVISNFILKSIIALMDTPFLYLAVRIKPNEL